MLNREHLLAVLDFTPDSAATLELAHQTVERGGRTTLVMMLSPQDRRHIRAFADAEELAIGEAEAIYIDRASQAYLEQVGGDDTDSIVTQGTLTGRTVMDTAARANATAVAVPTSWAARRTWRSALRKTSLPIIIAPARAA